MTDTPGEADPAPPAHTPADAPTDDPGGTGADRRAFLNSLSRDAVSTAGKVAGFSAMIRRGVFAAGESLAQGFPPPADGQTSEPPRAAGTPQPASAIGPEAAAAVGPESAPAPTPATTAAPSPSVPPAPTRDPVATLTPDQLAFLTTMPRVILAALDPSGSPHLTVSDYHWDGSSFRLPAQQFTLRASNVEGDPRVALFIEDEASGASVSVSGTGRVVYGEPVGDLMRLILGKYGSPEDVGPRWEALRRSGDRGVIEITPRRFVWRVS